MFCVHVWGQTVTVTQVLAGDNTLTPTTGTVMVTDPASGTDESSAMIGFYPIDSASSGAIQVENTIFSTNAGHPLPQVVYGGTTTAYNAVPFVAFKVKSTFTTTKRVFIAYKTTGGSYLANFPLNADGGYGIGTYVSLPANSETLVKVALKDICSTATTSTCYTNFNSFVLGNLSTIVSTYQFFYVYYVDPQTNPTYNPSPYSTTVDTTGGTYPGVLVKVSFSSQVPTPQPILSTINLARGDTQLTLNYTTGFSNLGDGGPWRTLVLKVNSTTTEGDNIFDAVGGSLVSQCTADGVPGDLLSTAVCYQLYPYLQNGALTVSNLTNDQTYLLTVGHVSKFKFVTTLPTNGSGRPQEIQAFIKEQSCFFLSAGFGDRHYILDYMRNFRDTFLLKNTLGKLFVNFYYNFAPQYTPYIYENPSIAFLMRIVGYGLYYFLNAWMVILSAITALFTFFKFKKFL